MPEQQQKRSRLKGCLWGLFKLFIYFILFCLAYVALVLYSIKDNCVRLTNGYMIGHPAIFHSNDGSYEMVLRDPTGKVILRTDFSIRFSRHPTNPKLVILEYSNDSKKHLIMPGEGMMDLIYPEEENERKWNEPNLRYPNDTSIFLTDLYYVLLKLKYHDKYSSIDCNTPWFDWQGQGLTPTWKWLFNLK